MTLGVRVLATDAEGRVLLVEHTYSHGWHFPGGGVDRGETAVSAAARELLEEAGLRALRPPVLLSVHDNGASYPGDHILFYRVEAWERGRSSAQGEIARAEFFPPDALPRGAGPGTRRRIAEVFGGAPADPLW